MNSSLMHFFEMSRPKVRYNGLLEALTTTVGSPLMLREGLFRFLVLSEGMHEQGMTNTVFLPTTSNHNTHNLYRLFVQYTSMDRQVLGILDDVLRIVICHLTEKG